MSNRWPGWHTLPGIDIAPLAEKARAQGSPCRHYAYVWGPDEHYVTTCGYTVDADGTLTVSGEGWEALIEDGMLTGFRGLKSGNVERLVQISALVVPEGEPPWTPSLTTRLPPEQIGMFRRGDTMADGIDIDADEPGGSISIGFLGEDGSMTSVSWGVTSQSAASVIALIRERHGEPLAEFTAPSADAFGSAAASALAGNGVFTCAHDAEAQ